MDRFVDPNVHADPEELRRQRLTAGAATAIVANAVPLMIANLVTVGAVRLAAVCFAVGIPLMVANLLALRAGWSRPAIGTAVTVELFVFCAAMTFDSGGIDSAALWWLLVVPMVAVLLRGTRLGWIMAALVALLAGMLVVLDYVGVVIPDPLSDVEKRVWHGLGLATVALFVAALSWYYERERREARAALVAAQAELTRAAHTAGMAEIASGVLHNVGNALNSVGVSVDLVKERVAGLDGAKLRTFIDRARAQPSGMSTLCTRDGGERVLAYLAGVAKTLDAHHQQIEEEVGTLRHHLDHIKVVVSKQQSHARRGGVSESCVIGELLRDAVLLVGDSITRHGMALRISGDTDTELETDPHRVLQILVNLLGNARDALRDQRGAKISVEVTAHSDELEVCVRDNGCGMTSSQLDKLFTYGFTTKKDGHGFGLHNGAIAVEQLGGRLEASSDGPGQGAVFVLSLPFARARALPCAS